MLPPSSCSSRICAFSGTPLPPSMWRFCQEGPHPPWRAGGRGRYRVIRMQLRMETEATRIAARREPVPSVVVAAVKGPDAVDGAEARARRAAAEAEAVQNVAANLDFARTVLGRRRDRLAPVVAWERTAAAATAAADGGSGPAPYTELLSALQDTADRSARLAAHADTAFQASQAQRHVRPRGQERGRPRERERKREGALEGRREGAQEGRREGAQESKRVRERESKGRVSVLIRPCSFVCAHSSVLIRLCSFVRAHSFMLIRLCSLVDAWRGARSGRSA